MVNMGDNAKVSKVHEDNHSKKVFVAWKALGYLSFMIRNTLGILSLFLIYSGTLMAESPARKFISTTGECILEAASDRLGVSFVARARDMSLKKAQAESRKKYDELVKALKALNLKDAKIETSLYNVHENREWENNKTVFKGYIVEMGVDIETSEVSRGGEALEAGAKAGLTDVGSLRMFLSDAKKKELRFQCLSIASEDAMKKAQKIAESLNIKLGAAEQVNEQSSFDYHPSPRREYRASMAMMEKSMDSAPQIENQSQKLSLTLNVSFGIK